MGPSARMTALSDISVYTQTEDELSLQEILTRMKDHLKGGPAPNPRSKDTNMPAFFEAVISEYDRERFYTSHMKKVLEWYNVLQEADALEFEEPETEASDAAAEAEVAAAAAEAAAAEAEVAAAEAEEAASDTEEQK